MEDLVNGSSYATQRLRINSNFDSAQTQIDQVWKEGIQTWNLTVAYTLNALSVGSDGFVYKCILAGAGNDPISSPTNWVLYGTVGTTYTITNPPVDVRAFDPATVTLQELGNIVATFLKDMSN